MWRYILPIVIPIAVIVLIVIKYNKKPIVFAPSPEKKFIIVKIHNTVENETKHFSLESDQIVCVFLGNQLVDSINMKDFSIAKYAIDKNLNIKDIQFKKYHFYIFNHSVIHDLGLKIESPIKYIDYDYSLPISVTPKGIISFEFNDIGLMFNELNLFRDSYTYTQFFDEIRGRLLLLVTRGIIAFSYEHKISTLLLNYYLDDIDSYVNNIIDLDLTKIGIKTTKVEFIDFVIDQSDDLKKIDLLVLQKQKYKLLNYTYVDERKIQLMKTIKFNQKASIDKTVFIEDVKRTI